MTTYIESTPLPDGTYDHTEVREAYEKGAEIELFNIAGNWFNVNH